MSHLPTLRTRIRWRVQDVFDSQRPLIRVLYRRLVGIEPPPLLGHGGGDETLRLEEKLCEEIEKLLTDSKIDLDSTK